MRRALALVVSAAALLAAGCNRQPTDTIDDGALQAIGDAVAAQLNEPPQAILKLVKDLDRPSPIALEALQISVDQKLVPVDWWLLKNNLVAQILPPPSPDRPTFLITPQAAAFVGQGPAWFTAAAGEPSKVDCHGGEATAAGGCEVDLPVAAQLTPIASGLNDGAPLDPIKLTVLVAHSGEGWQVREIRTNGASLHDYALNALLGAEAARATARQQALSNVTLGNAMGASLPPTPIESSTAATSPQLPPVDTAPVAPVVGDSSYLPKRKP